MFFKQKRHFLCTLLGMLWLVLFAEGTGTLEAAAGVQGPVVLQPSKSGQNENVIYSVGLGRVDTWTNSAGQYIADPYLGDVVRPGTIYPEAHYDWEYQFIYPGRKIKSIEALTFNTLEVPGETLEWAKAMFERARFGETWDYYYPMFATVLSVDTKSKKGLGTDTASIVINESFIIPTSGKNPERLDTTGLAKGVVGLRYYFPILFKAELEPLGGKAIVKHFSTNNVSLDGIDGFKDYELKLEINEPYTFPPAPDTAKFKYKYYKKKIDGDPSNESNTYGNPMSIIYDGKYGSYNINLYYEGEDPPPPGGGECTDPTPTGQAIEMPLTSPDPSAVIKADSRGSERFNVLDGIPTTESLYGNVLAKSYLHKNKFAQYSGKCTFNIEVSREYTLTWDPKKTETGPDGKEREVPDPQEDTETLTQTHTVEREYSFWTIENLEVYKIDEAKLWNYAFNGGGITILPSGYSPPVFSSSETHEFTPPSPPASIEAPPGSKSGGKDRPDLSGEDLKSFAEAEVDPVKVKNDTLTFNGSTIMNGSETSQAGPTPSQIPISPAISESVLYSPGNVIPTSKTNKANQPSTGTIYYGLMSGNINGGSDQSYPIYGINSVTVHTPVVMYASISDDAEHNQKTVPAAGRSALILERSFTVSLPNSGQHQSYLGYGYNNYLKYIGSKQIRFPFDVYGGANQQQFIPKHTWIEVEKEKESFVFYLPVWVDEGFYEVEMRTIAHNAPTEATGQSKANLNVPHHIAEDRVAVDVIGRLYDLRITDIADYNWESVFRQNAGSALPTGVSYWVGMNGIDGASRGLEQKYTLPVAPGSHPLYNNAAVKTGYHFKFELKTKGNMFGLQDRIRITPSFYFVNSKSGQRQPVDLYYHAGNNRFVKVGSSADQLQRYVVLNDRLRNVPVQELTDTALYKYDHDYTFAQISGISRQKYIENYINKYSMQKTQVGSLSRMELNERIRTFIGPKSGIPAGVDAARANASIQKWYGEYSLPAAVYAVAKGVIPAEYGRTHQGLTDRSPIFLKDGYIVVNFNLETIREGISSQPHLQYIRAPLMNQWTQMEGFLRATQDPYGRSFPVMDGDVLFYEADQSSQDDFRSMVIH